jgi:hypothetical protein
MLLAQVTQRRLVECTAHLQSHRIIATRKETTGAVDPLVGKRRTTRNHHPDKDYHQRPKERLEEGEISHQNTRSHTDIVCSFEGQACSQPTLFPSLLKNPRQRITVAFDSISHISPSPCTHLWIDPTPTVNQKLTLCGIATPRKVNSNSGRAMKSSPIWTNVSNKKRSACCNNSMPIWNRPRM